MAKINSVSCLTEFHQASFVGVFGVFPGDASPKPDRHPFSKLFEQSEYMDIEVGVVFAKSELPAYGTADIHMSRSFHVVAHFLAVEPDGVQTYIVYLTDCQSVLLEIRDESGMRGPESQTVGIYELLPVVGHIP